MLEPVLSAEVFDIDSPRGMSCRDLPKRSRAGPPPSKRQRSAQDNAREEEGKGTENAAAARKRQRRTFSRRHKDAPGEDEKRALRRLLGSDEDTEQQKDTEQSEAIAPPPAPAAKQVQRGGKGVAPPRGEAEPAKGGKLKYTWCIHGRPLFPRGPHRTMLSMMYDEKKQLLPEHLIGSPVNERGFVEGVPRVDPQSVRVTNPVWNETLPHDAPWAGRRPGEQSKKRADYFAVLGADGAQPMQWKKNSAGDSRKARVVRPRGVEPQGRAVVCGTRAERPRAVYANPAAQVVPGAEKRSNTRGAALKLQQSATQRAVVSVDQVKRPRGSSSQRPVSTLTPFDVQVSTRSAAPPGGAPFDQARRSFGEPQRTGRVTDAASSTTQIATCTHRQRILKSPLLRSVAGSKRKNRS
eukprot:Hpha_TRINITY_DN16503_c2_g5::TRINITY_DN16503_c2_g5_i1::g.132334::m.132334